MKAAKLPIEQVGDAAIVRVESIFSFVDYMSRREGIDNLGVEVGLSVQERALQGPLRDAIALAPTLLEGIKVVSRHARAESSHMAIGVEDRGDSVALWHRGPHSDHPGFSHMETYFVQSLLGIARLFLGPGWHPPVIGLESPRAPERVREIYPRSRILCAQPLHFIEIPRVLLCRPPARPAAAKGSVASPEPPLPAGFAESLRALLESYVSETKLSLDFAAQLSGVSTRTLQRQLRDEGSSFTELLGHARYRVAARMLRDPANTVTDVAHFVGYDDSAHFARAFRRIAGVPPKQFRRSVTAG